VDNIRDDILANIVYAPTQLKKKIYVIDEVHMLSKSAFNALLKTIEEPQDYLSFIFATTEVNKVPETIVSRCQVFNFKKVDPQDMIPRLQKICELENLVYEDEALALISKISE
jgi:DNA polymerase-3 subunit gamma/tau